MKGKQFITTLLALIIVGGLFSSILPQKASATTPLPFAGITSFPITCTCSATVWVWYTPLYLGNLVSTGPLVYSPYSTILWANYMIGVPSTWALGSYVPGVQACWMYAVVGCFPLPSVGLMFQAGTSAI